MIGQLAKNANYEGDSLHGSEIIQKALAVIRIAVESVGGRIVLVECRNVEPLKKFYISNKFSLVDDFGKDTATMVQMIRQI